MSVFMTRIVWAVVFLVGLSSIIVIAQAADTNPVGMLLVLALPFVGLWFYFLPSINARERRHPNVGAIFVVNLFLGWTFLGWVLALAWSCTEARGRNPAIN
jgi:hypothetical protein